MLVLRVWLGGPSTSDVHARVMGSLDVTGGPRESAVLGTAGEVEAFVADWLARFAGGAATQRD